MEDDPLTPTLRLASRLMTSVLPALFLLAGSVAASAQPAAGTVSCHAGGDFVVVAREKTDEAGSEFLVRRAPARPGPCTFKPEAGDYRIGGAEPYHFLGLGRHHLVLTASTGPAADLVIFDLAARKRVLSQRMTETSEPKLEGDTVSFTLRVGPGDPKSCKDWARFKKDGGSGEIGAPATFDLASGKMARGAGTVCTYAQ